MFNFTSFFVRLLLALSLCGAMGQAAAGPIYRVDIDTASLGTGSAFLGLYFMGLEGAPAASATVEHLAGALDGAASLSGSVSGSGSGPFVFSSVGGGGDLVQAIELGGKFSFDVAFAMAPGSTGMTFGWALFDSVQYLGANGDLGNLFLQPDAPLGEQVSWVIPSTGLSKLTVIPEPSTAALVAIALLAMLAWRREGAGRA